MTGADHAFPCGERGRAPVAAIHPAVASSGDAQKTGAWLPSRSVGGFIGASYLHDGNEGQGTKSVVFKLPIEKSGKYEVRLSYTPNPNRATNVQVTIAHAGGQSTVTVNQRKPPEIADAFVSLGEFEFTADRSASVTVSNTAADGHVIADAVWLVGP